MCSKARDTWAHSPFLSSLSVVPFRSFFDFLWYIILDADWSMEDVGLAITIAWALWSIRNDVIHGIIFAKVVGIRDLVLEGD